MTLRQRRLAGSAPSAAAGAEQINVTPVLNMFTILIPFLVTMTAFSHLAVQAFQLPSNEAPGQAQTIETVPLTVALGVNRVTVVHADRVLATMVRPLAGSGPDGDPLDELAEVASVLARLRAELPSVQRVVVAVDDPVTCEDLVTCLDRCREAGFTEVSLAAGANLDH